MQEFKPIKEGKVREVYDNGESLIITATDRISAFDHILKNKITKKGAILTQMSKFWFDFTKDICNLLEYLTQRDIQTKNSGGNVRYRGKHRFFKGFNEFIKEKTRRCDNDFEKIERHVFF